MPGSTEDTLARLCDRQSDRIKELRGINKELLDALKNLRSACGYAYKSGRVDALAFVEAGNVIAKAEAK